MAAGRDYGDHFREPRYIQVAQTRLRYLDIGRGPVVLLLHGIGHSVFAWRHSLDPLVAAGFRVVALDTPGFGESELPPGITRASLEADITACLLGFLNELGIRDCDVVGHSLGGAYAAILAMAHPTRVRRLVLAAPALGPYLPLRFRLLSLPLVTLAPGRRPDVLRRSFRGFVHRAEAIEQAEIDELVRSLARPGVQAWFLRLVRHAIDLRGIRPEFRLLGRLGGVTQPTLVIWGRHDRILSVRNAELIETALPHARLEILEESGHMVIYEEVDRFNALLIEFLGEAPGASVGVGDDGDVGAQSPGGDGSGGGR